MTHGPPSPPPGWYRYGGAHGLLRYWDGRAWTDRTAPVERHPGVGEIEWNLTWTACAVTWVVTAITALISPLFMLNDGAHASAQVSAGFECVGALILASCADAVVAGAGWRWTRSVRVGLIVAGWVLVAAAYLHFRALS